jgi:hypothetical protein
MNRNPQAGEAVSYFRNSYLPLSHPDKSRLAGTFLDQVFPLTYDPKLRAVFSSTPGIDWEEEVEANGQIVILNCKGITDPASRRFALLWLGELPCRISIGLADPTFSLGSTTEVPFMSDGEVHEAKIVSVPGSLTIFLDDLSSPVLTVPVDLEATLNLDNGQAWVGLTAATGGVTEAPRYPLILI